jgi:predicted nucleic acid-binding protein
MRKLKIYLDTSVISHLFAEDTPEKMQDTLEFWEDIKSGKYEIYISEVVMTEILNCNEPRRSKMLSKIENIDCTVVSINTEIEMLANEIVSRGILSQKSIDDCFHIATAVISDCNIIVSWNFKHIVKRKTINGVREIAISKEYRILDIYSPPMLLDKED